MARRIGVVVAIALAILGSACTASERDTYSYEEVEDDALAEDLYLRDQLIAVGTLPNRLRDAEFRDFVATQTSQICEALSAGTSFEELVAFMSETFVFISEPRRFVGNAAGYSCPHELD